jgi:formylglycine-generating enzyme required for sulfatase activity
LLESSTVTRNRRGSNFRLGRFPDQHLAEDAFVGVAPADRFAPNGFGLFTMTGNTWEWCADYFDTEWQVCASRWNPTGPAAGVNRVLMGGSYLLP